MRRSLIASVVLALAASTGGTAHAADPLPIAALTCGAALTTLASPGFAEGLVTGGPVVALGWTRIECTVQLGGTGLHNDTDDGSVRSEHLLTGVDDDVAVLVSGGLTFPATPGRTVWLCTKITVGSTTWYYDDQHGSLTTNAATRCAQLIHLAVPPVEVYTALPRFFTPNIA
jgi:hypothetical protein